MIEVHDAWMKMLVGMCGRAMVPYIHTPILRLRELLHAFMQSGQQESGDSDGCVEFERWHADWFGTYCWYGSR